MKTIYRLNELAARLDVSPRLLAREISRGRLPACRVGRSWMIAKSDIVKYVGGSDRAADIITEENNDADKN